MFLRYYFFAMYIIVDVSGWAAVLMAFYISRLNVGGAASISAASNQPVCVHLRCSL
jgi:hypothetical protein